MTLKNYYFFIVIFIFFSSFACYAQEQEIPTMPTDQVVITSEEALSWMPGAFRDVFEFRILTYPVWRIIIVLLLLIVGIIISQVVIGIIKRVSRKIEEKEQKKTLFSSTLFALRRALCIVVWIIIMRIIASFLIPEHAPGAIWISDVLITLSLVIFIFDFIEVIDYYLLGYVKKTETKLDDMLVPIVKNSIRIVVIAIAAMQLYQNISGQNITTILAGLGLAGMAVALAAQDSLKNLFGFIMIVLDQPFKVGERISFEGHDGVIEEVGLRSVRMRRLDGHLVTIPNQMAADKMIHNIARRPFISRLMDIGITYDTPVEKVKKAVEIVKDILKDHEGMNPDYPPRVFFKDFKADSLNIFAIYWYFPPSYWDFMAHCEYVNLEILKRFNKAGIEFAFPTQTVYLAGDEKRKLVLKHDRLDEIFGKIDIKG